MIFKEMKAGFWGIWFCLWKNTEKFHNAMLKKGKERISGTALSM